IAFGMCPPWSYALSLRRWWSTQVITTWRKVPCQSRRLPRSGIFTVHSAATRSRCQSPISPSSRARLGSGTSTTSFVSTRWCRRSCRTSRRPNTSIFTRRCSDQTISLILPFSFRTKFTLVTLATRSCVEMCRRSCQVSYTPSPDGRRLLPFEPTLALVSQFNNERNNDCEYQLKESYENQCSGKLGSVHHARWLWCVGHRRRLGIRVGRAGRRAVRRGYSSRARTGRELD